MRHRALALILVAGIVLAGCDLSGLPQTPNVATPTSATSVEATPTSGSISQRPTRAPRVEATSTSEPNGQATPAPTSVAVDTTPLPTTQANAEEAEEIKQVEQAASQLRELKPKATVPRTFLTQEQLRANLTKDMEEDYPKAEAEQDAVELWLLRFTDDRDLDLYNLYIDLLSEQVAGYYDPEKDEFFVLREDSDELGLLNKQTLAHEYVHALQDQYYDLEKLLPDESEDDDGGLAKRALIEGDATLSGQTYLLSLLKTPEDFDKITEEIQDITTDVLDKTPRYLRESLTFPYVQGLAFAEAVQKQGGYAAVNAALADPPKSTEQILHPDKYIKTPRDEPQVVALPPLTDTLGSGWKRIDGGTFGEFDIQVLLDENGARRPERAAAGWDGGLYEFYQNGDQALLLFKTVWDNQKEADEYETALRETFRNSPTQGELWSDDGRYFGLKRVGEALTLVAATSREAVEKALGAVK